MNDTFTHLLDVAYADGGGLLKFGGDALLLLFTGDGHTTRAARAAHGMRRTLREIGRPQTSAGRVTLRMHVGIHSGTFHFFLVGDTHRELLVTGPGATATVALEDASEAGEGGASAAAGPGGLRVGGRLGARRGQLVLGGRGPATGGGGEGRQVPPVRTVSDAELRLAVRNGVNRGRVFAGEVGAPFRRT